MDEVKKLIKKQLYKKGKYKRGLWINRKDRFKQANKLKRNYNY